MKLFTKDSASGFQIEEKCNQMERREKLDWWCVPIPHHILIHSSFEYVVCSTVEGTKQSITYSQYAVLLIFYLNSPIMQCKKDLEER